MTDELTGTSGGSVAVDDDPFGGVPRASRARRLAAAAVDALAILGSPWLLLPAAFGILVVSAFWGIPLWVFSCVAAVLLLWARRQPNGDRLSTGQLLGGLTVIRTSEAHLVVRAADAAAHLRPSRRRIAAGWVALSLATLALVGIWGTAAFVYYEVSTQDERASAQEAEWFAHEGEARVLVDAFITDLLSSNPHGGSGYVAEAAQQGLPGYRGRIRREGVTAFRVEGNGQGPGEWEYMFIEENPVQSGTDIQRSVSFVVTEVDGRLRITQIAQGEAVDPPAADAP